MHVEEGENATLAEQLPRTLTAPGHELPNWADRARFVPRSPLDYLDEQEVTDLLHRAGSRTINPETAQVLLDALGKLTGRTGQVGLGSLTLVQPVSGGGYGSSAPDLLVVDEDYKVHFVIEVKVRARSNKQSDGKWQIEAYEQVRDGEGYLAPTKGRAPDISYVLLDARGRSVEEAFPGASLRGSWTSVGMRNLAEALLDGSAAVADVEGCRYLRHVAAELTAADRDAGTFAREAAGPVTDLLLHAQVDAASRYPTPQAVEIGTRLAAVLHAADTEHALDEAMLPTAVGNDVGYQANPRRWVAHRVTWEDVTLWLGVPDPTVEAPTRHRGMMVPATVGPLGRLYVLRGENWDDQRCNALKAAMDAAGLIPVTYHPWEYRAEADTPILGYWGFHPLLGTGSLLISYQRALTSVIVSVTQALRRLTGPAEAR